VAGAIDLDGGAAGGLIPAATQTSSIVQPRHGSTQVPVSSHVVETADPPTPAAPLEPPLPIVPLLPPAGSGLEASASEPPLPAGPGCSVLPASPPCPAPGTRSSMEHASVATIATRHEARNGARAAGDQPEWGGTRRDVSKLGSDGWKFKPPV